MQTSPDAFVTGATGLIGRWLVPELTRQERNVMVLIRNADQRAEDYRTWVKEQGGDPARLSFHELDLNAQDLGLSGIDVSALRDVYHLVARYEFGLSRKEARDVAVEGSLRLLHWCKDVPNLRRYVFITGYQAAAHAQLILAAPESQRQAMIDKHYRDAGAYEASKVEENVLVQTEAERLGLPYTVINPSAVIGDSVTGETLQFIGPSDLVRDLYFGKMPALVGGPDLFVPLVTVDHVASFMARIPEIAEADGQSYCLLDQTTPRLHDLLAQIANHLGVACPTRSVPKGLVAALPKAVTGVEKEALTFLTNRKYDTANSEAIAATLALSMPDFDNSLRKWIDYLVSKQFGQAPAHKPGQYRDTAGARTHVVGNIDDAEILFLHGMPLDSESWGELEGFFGASTARADLPGHGRNGGLAPEPLSWMEALLENNTGTPLLVAHSIGCEYALRFASAHPERVKGVVLISPFFVQKPAPRFLRMPGLVSLLIKAMGPRKFVAKALESEILKETASMESAAASLSRPGKRRRFASELARASTRATRAELQGVLGDLTVPVTVIFGENDPISGDCRACETHAVADSGHYPQLSHASAIAAIIRASQGNEIFR